MSELPKSPSDEPSPEDFYPFQHTGHDPLASFLTQEYIKKYDHPPRYGYSHEGAQEAFDRVERSPNKGGRTLTDYVYDTHNRNPELSVHPGGPTPETGYIPDDLTEDLMREANRRGTYESVLVPGYHPDGTPNPSVSKYFFDFHGTNVEAIERALQGNRPPDETRSQN